MAWEFSLLVVADVTAGSDELIGCLRERSDKGACRFTLVMPASGADARKRLDSALERLRAAGLENVDGLVGDPDPVVAVARPRPAAPAREAHLGPGPSCGVASAAGGGAHRAAARAASAHGRARRARRNDYAPLGVVAWRTEGHCLAPLHDAAVAAVLHERHRLDQRRLLGVEIR